MMQKGPLAQPMFERGKELESILAMPSVTQYSRSIANSILEYIVSNDDYVVTACDRDSRLPTKYILDLFRRPNGTMALSNYFAPDHFEMLGLGSPNDTYAQIANEHQNSLKQSKDKPFNLNPRECFEQAVFNELNKVLAEVQMHLFQTFKRQER